MLHPIDDLSPADWIRAGVQQIVPPNSPNWRGNFVSHCFPAQFAAYCKLLHPIYEDLDVKDHSTTWDEAAGTENMDRLANGNAKLRQMLADWTLVRGWPEETFRGQRITWRELAQRYGVVFQPEINESSFSRRFPRGSWPRYLVGPAEGTLDDLVCERLVELLAPATADQTCFFLYDVVATCTTERPFKGRLADVRLPTSLPGVRSTPTYWWPDDRQWLLCTDWDLTFSLVGAPASLIAQLLADQVLECVAVTPETRVDYQADRLNEG